MIERIKKTRMLNVLGVKLPPTNGGRAPGASIDSAQTSTPSWLLEARRVVDDLSEDEDRDRPSVIVNVEQTQREERARSISPSRAAKAHAPWSILVAILSAIVGALATGLVSYFLH